MDLVKKLGHLWLSALVEHDISIGAASYLWKIAFKWIDKITIKREQEGTFKPIPQFDHLRTKLIRDLVPPVSIRCGFRDLNTNEIIKALPSDISRVKAYEDQSKYKKVFEISSVQIKDILKIHSKLNSNHQRPSRSNQISINLSCDGVADSKSSSVSMDVFSLSFPECRNIYPIMTIRPQVKGTFSFQDEFSLVLDDLKMNKVKINNILADNPMRALMRCAKNHSSYYSCEYCRAAAEYYEDPEDAKKHKPLKKEFAAFMKKSQKRISLLVARIGTDRERTDDVKKMEALRNSQRKREKEFNITTGRKKKVN